MTKAVIGFLLLSVLLSFVLAISACEQDDGEDTDDDAIDDDTDDDSCDEDFDNHPPALLEIHYILKEEELTPPIIISSDDSANLGIYFEYADEDCNLAGGHQYVRFTAPEETKWEKLGVWPEEVMCSSADSGSIYGFGFKNSLSAEAYAGETKWTDICGDASNVMTWEFTVTEE